MTWALAIAVGIILGCLYGIILWASMDALSVASLILYGDAYKIPLMTTAVSMAIALAGILSYTYWEKHAQNAIVWLSDWLAKQREMNELDDDPRDEDWLTDGRLK